MTNARTRGAVIVTRVSTGEQVKHGTSLESQLAMCRAKAAALSLPIIAEYEDAAVSGAFLVTREGIQSALADIRQGRADTVIFASSSRMTREREHMEIIKRTVYEAGGRIVLCDMDYTDTPDGNLHLNVKNDFDVYERTLFRARSMKGKVTRAGSGEQPARSLSPYGYHVPSKEDVMHGRYPLEQLGRYVINEQQAAIVRRIFAGYAAGTHTMRHLCKELNTEGVPTPKGASAWRPATIRSILANPVHKGEAAYGKVKSRKMEEKLFRTNPLTGRPYKSPVMRIAAEPEEIVTITAPAIVPAELWERAQERSAHNKAHQGGNPARTQMLSGLTACPVCGGGMRYEVVKRQWRYYQCHTHMESQLSGGPLSCDKTCYLVDTAEAAVLSCLLDVVERPETVQAQLAVYNKVDGTNRDEARREIAAVDKALVDLKQQEAAAVQAQIQGIMAGASPHAYAEAFAQIAARRKDLEDRRGQLRRVVDARSAQARATTADEVRRQALADVRLVLTSPAVSGHVKRDALAMLVAKVIPRKDGADIVFLPGMFMDWAGDTVQCMSTPQPKKATVRPSPSNAP